MKPEESLDFHIKRTWHQIFKMYNQIAQQYDLTQATGFVLLHIDAENGSPSTSIAPLMGMEVTSLSRILRNMEADGLIYRKTDTEDKRKVRIFLTEKGLDKRQIAKKVVKGFNAMLQGDLGDIAVESTIQILERVNELSEIYKQQMIVKA